MAEQDEQGWLDRSRFRNQLRDLEATAYALGVLEGLGEERACRAYVARSQLFTMLNRQRMALEGSVSPVEATNVCSPARDMGESAGGE